MKKTIRAAAAALLIAGSLVATAPPAEAGPGCTVTKAYSSTKMWATAWPSGCNPSKIRVVLKYFVSPKGVTTYSAAGKWVYDRNTSSASVSTSLYFAGVTNDWLKG